jgi:hypothetical protein
MTEEQQRIAEKIAAAEERSAKAKKEAAAAARDQLEYDEKLTLSQKRSLSAQGISRDKYLEQKKIQRQIADDTEREKEAKQKIASFDSNIANLRKKNRDISKDILKVITKGSGQLVQNLGIDEQSVRARQQFNDATIAALANEDFRSKKSQEELDSLEEQVKVNNTIGDIEKEILQELETGGVSRMTKEDVLNSMREKGVDLSKLTAEQLEKMEEEAERIAKATENMDENFQKAYEETGRITQGLQEMIDKADTFAGILSNSQLRSVALRGAILGVAGAFAKDVFDSAKDVRQELGLSITDSAKFGFQITRNAKLLGILGGNAEEVKNFSVEIANEFGNIGNLTDDTLKQFVDLSAATGLTGQNAAKLANSIMSIQGGTLETSLNTIKIFENLARAEGVSSKIILEDLAEDADKFAEFAKDGGKNLAEAAIAARKLGMNLSTVAGIADKLLEFETSIENQMQAQVLLGRSINLDKARELALSGNLKGLAEEVKNQVGSQAEFEAMNVVQRRALAEALGTSVADLGRMVRGEDTSAQLAEKRAAAEVKRGETQLEIMKAMEAMTQLMLVGQGISAAMLVVDQARTALAGTRTAAEFAANRAKGVGLTKSIGMAIAGLFESGSKVPFLLGIPLALGAIALLYNQISKAGSESQSIQDGFVDSQGNVISTPKGSINLDKDDDMLVGTNLFGDGGNQTSQPNVKVDFTALESTSAAQLKETKEMNQINKKLLRQNEALMRELITKTGNSSLANTV